MGSLIRDNKALLKKLASGIYNISLQCVCQRFLDGGMDIILPFTSDSIVIHLLIEKEDIEFVEVKNDVYVCLNIDKMCNMNRATFTMCGGRNDELVNLLGMYNNSTAELSDERDRLLVCIANYLEEQVDNAVDDLVHRMYISNAEIQDRNRVLVIANLDFKKNRFTMYDSSKPSSKWKIVKGAKNNPMSFDLSEAIGNLRGVRTRSLQVDIGFSNVSNYKDNTLYLI